MLIAIWKFFFYGNSPLKSLETRLHQHQGILSGVTDRCTVTAWINSFLDQKSAFLDGMTRPPPVG
jgi:hypothetical protein